jgi:hypothetical protein
VELKLCAACLVSLKIEPRKESKGFILIEKKIRTCEVQPINFETFSRLWIAGYMEITTYFPI